jgi:AcrR family transcriptional regulator
MGRPKEVTDEQIIVAARHCFLKHGAAVAATIIARDLGISHTTLFNRFRSKEALMIAALGPPDEVPWVKVLEAGPDDRPIREQLIEHVTVISTYFQGLHLGLSMLQAAGISPAKACRARKGKTSPEKAYRALVAWLHRAQKQDRLAQCNVEALASTILGALHGRAFSARVRDETTTPAANERYVEYFVQLLWDGIAGSKT